MTRKLLVLTVTAIMLTACGEQITTIFPEPAAKAPLSSPLPTPRRTPTQRELDEQSKDKPIQINSADEAIRRLRILSPIFAENEITPPLSPTSKSPIPVATRKGKYSDVTPGEVIVPDISKDTDIWIVQLPMKEWEESRGPAGATTKTTYNTIEFWLRTTDGKIIGSQKRFYTR